MEQLVIEDFLSIKKATINLKKINLFIGPQAQGKSLISKLISFFKEFPSTLFEAALEEKSKRQFDTDIKSKFESIFPKYAWDKSKYSILYSNVFYKVKITHEKTGAQFKWSIKYSDNIVKCLSQSRTAYKKIMSEEQDARAVYKIRMAANAEVRDVIGTLIFNGMNNTKLEQVIYIPAGRSFFANLQKNVFSFISSSIPIDHFLKEFGSIYERTRDRGFLEHTLTRRPKSIEKIFSDLICGNYLSEKGQDWIINGGSRVNLSNSSSGQQEVLPMAMVLSTWPYSNSPYFSRSFVVEEPEAHLFPIAQGQIASLIASAYNAREEFTSYTVTTHSPYILTAFNNLIQAGNVFTSAKGAFLERLIEIIPREQHIQFEDVTAYMVEKGTVREIMDGDLKLIDASAIDNVSDSFAKQFDRLIDLEISIESESQQ